MTRKNPVVAAMRDLRDIYGPDVEIERCDTDQGTVLRVWSHGGWGIGSKVVDEIVIER